MLPLLLLMSLAAVTFQDNFKRLSSGKRYVQESAEWP